MNNNDLPHDRNEAVASIMDWSMGTTLIAVRRPTCPYTANNSDLSHVFQQARLHTPWPSWLSSLTWLADTAFVIGNVYDHCFAIELYAWKLEDNCERRAHHIATFEFAPWRLGCRIPDTGVAIYSSLEHSGTQQPFIASDTSQLLIVERLAIQPQHFRSVPVFWLAISPRPFLDAVAAWKSTSVSKIIVPWQAWGPQWTRCFAQDARTDNTLQLSAHGSRVFSPVGDGPGDYMLDFNQLALQRSMHALQGQAGDDELPHDLRSVRPVEFVTTPSTIPREDIFLEDITTCLPYRKIPLEWPADFKTPFRRTHTRVFGGELWVASSPSDAVRNIVLVPRHLELIVPEWQSYSEFESYALSL